MRRVSIASVIVLGSLALAGCSSNDDAGSGSGVASATTGCSADTRKDVYTTGLTKQAGSFSIKIVEAAPSPPSKGTNAMTFELLDQAGTPVDGATMTITPFMPDHGHGSAVTPVVTASGGGKYAISKLYFAMAGLWRVTVSVQTPAAGIQEAAFQFCLDG
jgi:hypothetical protein